MSGTLFSRTKVSVLPPASLRRDHAKASSNLFGVPNIINHDKFQISPYTSYHYHQFFSAISLQTGARTFYHLSAVYCTSGGVAFFFFLGGICGAIHPALRCVASIEHSPASQRVACSFSLPLLRPVHDRSSSM